jgi:(S)-3,5-dihydroxyphenylglycine transaminase
LAVGNKGLRMRVSAPLRLSPDELHGSLQDPVLGSMMFLNEITKRYPDAISFAPGAPHPGQFDEIDVRTCVERFLAHLREDRGLDDRQARQLLCEYGPSRGIINDLVAAGLRRDHGLDITDSSVVITAGAQEAMFLALRVLNRTRDDVLAVVDPSYVGIIGAARLLDLPVVTVAETDHGPDLDHLEAVCRDVRSRGKRVRTLYVAPDFANPSGTLTDLPSRRRLLHLADQEDFILLEDTTYGFTASQWASLPMLKAMDANKRVVLLGTFSKVCLPGARVGYLVADQSVGDAGARRLLADEIATAKTMVTVNTSPIGQAVVGGMLLDRGGSLGALGAERMTLYRGNLSLLLDALDRNLRRPPHPPDVTWRRPAGGFFVRMRIPVAADPALLERSAAEHGVLWTPMAQFFVGDAGTHEIRLSCSYLDPHEIETGAARLAGFLGSL